MINVGIIGGDTSSAGELIRILINHPDVIIRQICAPDLSGRDIKAVHHGLIGECNLKFSDSIQPASLDVIFVTTKDKEMRKLIPSLESAPELCVIDMSDSFATARTGDPLVVYGVPEVNRKALVRGARRAVIPQAIESLICIAFLPLAMKSMLPSNIAVKVFSKEDLYDEKSLDITQIGEVFRLNGSMNIPAISFEAEPNDSKRVMRLKSEIILPLPLDNIMEMYEELYDDHNLTHVVGETVDDKEVEGTDKCIISLDKSADGNLLIEIVADARMRGGAGDAVHVMNLLTGLYEKTGLALKASNY